MIYGRVFFVLILSFSPFGRAEFTSVTPHYPESAFIIDRLLPFQVDEADNIEITRVIIMGPGSQGCFGFPDRFIKKVFHLYCDQPGSIDVRVEGDENGKTVSLDIDDLNIATQRAPSADSDPLVGGTAETSAEESQ